MFYIENTQNDDSVVLKDLVGKGLLVNVRLKNVIKIK